MKKWILRILIALVVIAAAAGGWYYKSMRDMGFFRTPVYETARPDVPALAHPAVLVFSKTNSFIHKDAIPAATLMLEQLAKQNGWSIYFSGSGAVHNAEDLAKFDVIVWNNVSGDVLTPDQRTALQNYLQNGGGFVGIHATGGDRSYDWAWHPETLIGAQFIGHPMDPQFQTATIHIEDQNDPIMQGLGATWSREDEWYSFDRSVRDKGFRVLATLDESTYSPKVYGKSLAMGADHPIIWKHCIKNGRAFYSALGHTAATYSEPKYQTLITHAIAWGAGLEGDKCVEGQLVQQAAAADTATQ
jgi:type 1 glutamine amidotransferase